LRGTSFSPYRTERKGVNPLSFGQDKEVNDMAILAECPVCHRRQSLEKKRCVSCGMDLDKEKENKRIRYHVVYRVNGKQKWLAVGSVEGCKAFSIEDARDVQAKFRTSKRDEKLDLFERKRNPMTFRELAEWYLNLEDVKDLASYSTITGYIGKFNSSPFRNRIPSTIKPMDLQNHQMKRKKEGLKPKTIDDEINNIKTMLRKASDNDLVSADVLKPFNRTKNLLSGKKRGTNARDRLLSIEEVEALSKAIKMEHTRDIFCLGYWTGMRAREVRKLRWSMVNLKDRIITLPENLTKEGKKKEIPISKEAHIFLTRDNRHIRKAGEDDHVFLYHGKPIGANFHTGLKTASQEAGIAWGREVPGGWIYHDLRRTFKTDMRKAKVDKTVRDSILGMQAMTWIHAITSLILRTS
jgi:integrase